jgi:hypothetical protein
MLAEIDNYVSVGPTDNDTNVRTDYGYDSYGQKTRTTRHNRDAADTDLDDRVDASVYDNCGDLTASITNYADGLVSSGGSDVTPDANGVRTDLTATYGYDTAGNQVSVADPRRAIELALGSAGADDYVTRSTFDALNESLSQTTPTTPGVTGVPQKTSTSVYDEFGSVRAATDQNGVVTGTAFDALEESLATYEIDPAPSASASQTSASTYTAGRLATSKDARQFANSSLGQTQGGYDDLGRQITVTDAAGSSPDTSSTTTSTYDGLGRKTSDTQDVGSSSYTFDLGGRTLTTDDGFTCSSSTYDFQDRVTSSTTGLNGGTCTDTGDAITTTDTSDGLGRLTRAEITAGQGTGDRSVDNVFDSAGDTLSASTRQAGVVATATSQINLLGQVVSNLGTDGATTRSNHDPAGNVTDSCLWAAGSTVGSCYPVGTTPWANPPTKATSSVYDAGNHAIASTDAATGMTTTYDPTHDYVVAATYLPTGSGHEYQTYFTYDGKNRVGTITHQDCTLSTGHSCSSAPVVGSDAYVYDGNDNRTRVTEFNGTATTDRFYCYDAKNQLFAEKLGSSCSTSPDETSTYDDSGDRTSATVGGGTTNFAYGRPREQGSL